MTEVRIENVVEHLRSEFKKALNDTMRELCPDASFDESEAFRHFLKRVGHRCRTWEEVPDSCIKNRD